MQRAASFARRLARHAFERAAKASILAVEAACGVAIARRLVAMPMRFIGHHGGNWGDGQSLQWLERLPGHWWFAEPCVEELRASEGRFSLDLRDNVQRTMFMTGAYERRFVSFLRAQSRRGDVYADIGSHVGLHAIAMAQRLRALGEGHVFAFEPAPDTAKALRWQLALSGVTNITLTEAALGSAQGSFELRSDPHWGEADLGVRSRYGQGHVVARVPVERFDDWADARQLERLDMVKIDVEGAELDVLRGMTKSLARLRPRIVTVEIKAELLERAAVGESDLDAYFHAHGYQRGREQFDENVIFCSRG